MPKAMLFEGSTIALEREELMNFRTSYLVGLMASALLVFSANPLHLAHAADPLKITGPDGEVRETNRQYGPTRSSDTFWSIAQKVRPDNSVDIYQVMAAIYDANPHAFSSANYNSLERGMILLIPSKAVMLAIPKSMAKERAARDDAGWRKATAATPQPKPVTLPETAPETAKPATEPTPSAVTAPATPDSAELEALTAKLEAAEAKALQLTDELARAEDQLNIGSSDADSLQNKIDELNEQIAILEEELQISKQRNESLNAEVEMLKNQVAALQQPVPEEDSDLWRNLMGNPLLLILGAAIPALLVLVLFWLFLKRRRNEGEESQEKEEQASESAAPEPTSPPETLETGDEAMAVHLDTDEDESIDSLMNIDTSELQPEVDMSEGADMFVDSGDTASEDEGAEDEGQSLDDLWAEAMGEQDEEEAKAEAGTDEEDLDSLLAGFDEKSAPAESESQDNSEIVSADDLDSLLADLDEPTQKVETDLSDEIATELSEDTATENVAEEDLDSLLADFETAEPEVDETELGTEPDLTDEIAAELEADNLDEKVSEEDLDSLLAGFDAPQAEAEPEVKQDLTDEIAAELESDESLNEKVSEEDLDSLLAGFDAPQAEAEPEVKQDLTDEIAAELESDESLNEKVSEEDLDSLLAGFDAPEAEAEPEVKQDLTDEIAAELEADNLDEKVSEEDLDSLLAGFDAPEAEAEPEVKQDLSDEIAAELESEESLNEEASEEDLDSLLAGFDAPEAEIEPKQDQSDEAVADLDMPEVEVAPESKPVDELVTEAEAADEKTEEDELDSLLADFDMSRDDIGSGFEAEPVEEEAKSKPETATGKDEALDALLADLESVDKKSKVDPVASKGGSGMFDDLKGSKKVEDNSLEWDGSLGFGEKDAAPTGIADAQTDAVEDKLTVDEALAALDADEKKASPAVEVDEHDLTSFQSDNGFIDIDRLLNEADEDVAETDQYKELDVDMGELDSLMGNASMVDVDDEENSVNAKLDLARAYIEIDDTDSAKALLKEVQLDGNERQQSEADSLIKTLE